MNNENLEDIMKIIENPNTKNIKPEYDHTLKAYQSYQVIDALSIARSDDNHSCIVIASLHTGPYVIDNNSVTIFVQTMHQFILKSIINEFKDQVPSVFKFIIFNPDKNIPEEFVYRIPYIDTVTDDIDVKAKCFVIAIIQYLLDFNINGVIDTALKLVNRNMTTKMIRLTYNGAGTILMS